MLSTSSTAVVPAPTRSLKTSTRSFGTPQVVKDVTRKAATVSSTPPPPPPPGTFRHPRMTEIISRRSKDTFTKRNVQIAVVNAVTIVATFVASSSLYSTLNWLVSIASLNDLPIGARFLITFFRLFLLSNILIALRPVLPYISKSDNVSDIPLTPTQRALLGLPTSRQSSTPLSNEGTAKYITPPRYRRSSSSLTSTPQSNNGFSSDRRSISASYSSSPLSTSRLNLAFSPSPQFQASTTRRASGSPFSPSSPLLHKALGARGGGSDVGEIFNQSTTSSFGMSTSTTGNLLGRSQSLKERGVVGSRRVVKDEQPSTPSPGSKRVQPGLNYKWLYDKGYRSPLDA